MAQQKNQDFLNEWKQQIEMKEQQKRVERLRKQEFERRELEEQMAYNPFGRAGGGAPLSIPQIPQN